MPNLPFTPGYVRFTSFAEEVKKNIEISLVRSSPQHGRFLIQMVESREGEFVFYPTDINWRVLPWLNIYIPRSKRVTWLFAFFAMIVVIMSILWNSGNETIQPHILEKEFYQTPDMFNVYSQFGFYPPFHTSTYLFYNQVIDDYQRETGVSVNNMHFEDLFGNQSNKTPANPHLFNWIKPKGKGCQPLEKHYERIRMPFIKVNTSLFATVSKTFDTGFAEGLPLVKQILKVPFNSKLMMILNATEHDPVPKNTYDYIPYALPRGNKNIAPTHLASSPIY
jgi:hypothetical protein